MTLLKLILKIPYLFYFILYYAYEVVLANIEVAYEVLRPTRNMKPGIVAVPLDLENEYGINLLANLITMTPGTMSVDVSAEKKVLFVYALHIKDRESTIKQIKTKLESKVLRLFK